MTLQKLVASWFGSGLLLGKLRGSHAGSGTVGSLAALGILWLLQPTAWAWVLAMACGTAALSLWSARPFSTNGEDPGWIVIDEVAGMFVAGIGLTGAPLLVAFVVFRFADITKKLPGVGWADRLHGPLGITLDDLIAGAYGLAAGWLFSLI
jgi:phosphatidylglycerophosphatase A